VCPLVALTYTQVIVIELALLDRVFARSLGCFCASRRRSRKDM